MLLPLLRDAPRFIIQNKLIILLFKQLLCVLSINYFLNKILTTFASSWTSCRLIKKNTYTNLGEALLF